jgi:hypothetical protein
MTPKLSLGTRKKTAAPGDIRGISAIFIGLGIIVARGKIVVSDPNL